MENILYTHPLLVVLIGALIGRYAHVGMLMVLSVMGIGLVGYIHLLSEYGCTEMVVLICMTIDAIIGTLVVSMWIAYATRFIKFNISRR